MQTFRRVVNWSLLGALVAGGVTFVGFVIFNYDEILGPKDSDEVQAWARFGAVMGSLGIAGVGFILGGIYGLVRVRRAAKS